MASFRFEAADSAGRIEKGLLEADSAAAARAVLRARGLVPLDQAENRAVREVFAAVRSDVFAGHRLAEALGQFPREFPEAYRASVAAGEDSGELAGVMERLATYLEERQALRWPTRALLLLSYVLREGALWIVLGLAAAFFGLRAWLARPGRRLVWDRWVLGLPLFGRIVRSVNTARFASTLAILTSAGVPLLRGLEAARATLANAVLATAVGEVIDAVRECQPLAPALGRVKVFPPVLVHLAASGEATGELAPMLERAATNLSREAERRALALSTLLEPLLILAMGAIVLGIVLAVLMPIIEINQLVR